MMWSRIAATLVLVFGSGALRADDVWVSRRLDLGNEARALRVDAARNVLYVSVPYDNKVVVVDLPSFAITHSLDVGTYPTGIDLSADGHKLYTALGLSGAIGVYDLNSGIEPDIDVSAQLGSLYTFDVAEALPGIVFATASPYSYGLAYVVRVDTSNLNATVVANQNIIRMFPIFGKDPTGKALYVGEESGFYKLDITQAAAPVVLQPTIGTNFAWSHQSISVNPTGTRIVLDGGWVVRASELTKAGYVGQGVAVYTSDGSQIVSAFGSKPIVIYRYDATTLDPVDSLPTNCTFPSGFLDAVSPTAIQALPENSGWAIIGGSTLCLLRLEHDELFGSGFD